MTIFPGLPGWTNWWPWDSCPELPVHAVQQEDFVAWWKTATAGAINLQDATVEWSESVGAIILALAATPAPAGEFPGYGHPDAVTSLQFERLLSATGPQGGRLVRPSDHTEPGRLAFIQCIGSRDPQAGAAYCSTVCCMTSLKEAVVAREISGQRVESTIFYMDLRAQGKGYEGYL